TVVDNILPAMNCAAISNAAATISKNSGCLATLPDYTTTVGLTTDICGIQSITQSPVAGTILAANVTSIVVTFTARDNNGNNSTCTRTITFVDNTPPIVTSCPANQVLSAGPASCSITATWVLPTFTDNCSPVDGFGAPFIFSATATGTSTLPTLTTSQTSATFFTGITTVTYIIRDVAGNTSTCVFTVTVNDNTNPVVTCPSPILTSPVFPADPGVCIWTKVGTNWDATATDNCLLANPTPLVYALTRPPSAVVIGTGTSLNGVVFANGVTRVTWTATDFSLNTSSCFFDVTVADQQLPSLTCPASVAMNTNFNGCRAQVPASLTAPTASDNCGIALTEWDVSGSTPVASGLGNLPNNYVFNVGVSFVQYRVTDAAGNFRTCSFTVTITNAVAGTISGTATVAQNISTTSNVTFAVIGGVAPYTFTYNVSINGGPVGSTQSITTVVGNSTVVPQSNTTVGTYRYNLLSVTDANGCAEVYAGPVYPNAVITVVAGAPDLTFEIQAFNTLSIAAGGTIQQVLGIRNQGSAPTSGPIVFTVSNYTAGSGLTAVSNNNASVTIGFTNYTLTNATDWVVTQPGGVGTPLFFTSALPIVPGQTKYVGITINRAAGNNGAVTNTATITSGTGGGETPTNNNSITNTITKN
ncbi:MAG: HYR domain-containing protein, partial [Bacteroidota bacterium]|nr:HYR domain-containing protein [Bacteroidota bacterium]